MGHEKTIGVLTSGGDAPGMNAAIRAVVRCGLHYGYRMMAINKGYAGLIAGDIEEVGARDVSDILQRGGTILQTARCKEFTTEEGVKKGIEVARIFGLDALVVIGGDGSFRGAQDMAKFGFPVIGIPGTIDNDIGCSEYTLGYDTALNTAMEAIDKIRDTATSHERCNLVEVMGRSAGHIALNVAIANGAEACIVPEKPFDLDNDIIKPIIEGHNRGKKHYIIIVAEGVGATPEMAKKIEEKTGVETRLTVLGYIQRGGAPTLRDRVMAGRMGRHAVELIRAEKYNRIVAWQQGKVVDIEIGKALAMKKTLNEADYQLAQMLSL